MKRRCDGLNCVPLKSICGSRDPLGPQNGYVEMSL